MKLKTTTKLELTSQVCLLKCVFHSLSRLWIPIELRIESEDQQKFRCWLEIEYPVVL